MRNTTNYVIPGTKFFRLGSRQLINGVGSNMQNWEKGLRRMYIPDEGKCFVQVDQSGADALIVSRLLKKGNKLRTLFENNIKPHCYIGLMLPHQWAEKFPYVYDLAKVKIEDLQSIKEWKELEAAIKNSDNNPPATRYYYHYKQTCHSGNYDIKENSFILNILDKSGGKVVLTPKQGKEYLSSYHSLLPELIEWHNEIRNQLYETHTLYNLFGHPYYFHTVNDTMFKEAYSAIPQGTVAQITNNAHTKMQDFIEENKAPYDLLNNCHDSYLAQCPIGEQRECANIMQKFMNHEFKFRGEIFAMKSEAQWGFNWSPKSEKNPEGLREF